MLRSKSLPIALSLIVASAATAHAAFPTFGAFLTGSEETPAIFTPATGTFEATLSSDATTLNYTLTYTGLSAQVTAAHIHFSQKHVPGGIIAFLCGGGGKPACPQEGTVTGTIGAGDITAVDAQGVPAGNFDVMLTALVSNAAYANVHTTAHPAGEIRGQIKS